MRKSDVGQSSDRPTKSTLAKNSPRTREGTLQRPSTGRRSKQQPPAKNEVLARENVRFPRKAMSGCLSPSHRWQIATDADGEDQLAVICSLNRLHNTNIRVANKFRRDLRALATRGVYRYIISDHKAPVHSNTPHCRPMASALPLHHRPMASAPPLFHPLPVHPELPHAQKEFPGHAVTSQAP